MREGNGRWKKIEIRMIHTFLKLDHFDVLRVLERSARRWARVRIGRVDGGGGWWMDGGCASVMGGDDAASSAANFSPVQLRTGAPVSEDVGALPALFADRPGGCKAPCVICCGRVFRRRATTVTANIQSQHNSSSNPL